MITIVYGLDSTLAMVLLRSNLGGILTHLCIRNAVKLQFHTDRKMALFSECEIIAGVGVESTGLAASYIAGFMTNFIFELTSLTSITRPIVLSVVRPESAPGIFTCKCNCNMRSVTVFNRRLQQHLSTNVYHFSIADFCYGYLPSMKTLLYSPGGSCVWSIYQRNNSLKINDGVNLF